MGRSLTRTPFFILIGFFLFSSESFSGITKMKSSQSFLELQQEEGNLKQQRLLELEQKMSLLEEKQSFFKKKEEDGRKKVRKYLSMIAIFKDLNYEIFSFSSFFKFDLQGPFQKVLVQLVHREVENKEALKRDFEESILLRESIQKEKQELTYQLHQLKQTSLKQTPFLKLKGRLSLPVLGGKVVSFFGRRFDPELGSYIFKKGIDLETSRRQSVRAISGGKIAYAGLLAHYGQVVIIDHGGHFYSLCGNLGKVSKKKNDSVQSGEAIGLTNESGVPLYFEIRRRNVAVNPLQWIFN